MTIFGDWLRQRARNIAGDRRAAAQLEAQDEADPLGVDLEATRQALLVSIRAEEQRRIRETFDRARERKEQSIIAVLVFGCSCGAAYCSEHPAGFGDEWPDSWDMSYSLATWLKTHAHCAGLGAMVREDA